MTVATIADELTELEKRVSLARRELAYAISQVARADAAHALDGSTSTLTALGEARAVREWAHDELEALVVARDALRERMGRT